MSEFLILILLTSGCLFTYLISYIYKGFSILLSLVILSSLIIYNEHIVLISIFMSFLFVLRVNNKKKQLDI